MAGPNNTFYARWRSHAGWTQRLGDDDDSPPEKLVQAIWQHQRLKRDRLKTAAGQPLKVLHPGFHSVEGGPDFRGAVIQIADEPPQTGDIEVDLRAAGWRAHGHDRNPAFGNVVLHVVWEGDRAAANGPPVVALRPVLDAPLGELNEWLTTDATGEFPEELRGRCCAPLRELSAESRDILLRDAALTRLRGKAAWFEARARAAGWEQALWEGLFRALGYKHNVWPMQRLGELRPRWQERGAEPVLLQARLLGLSGLLPAELSRSRSGSDNYVRRLWDQWWRDRDALADSILPKSLWRLHGQRPANQPQRRLALAAHWVAEEDLASRLEKWCGGQPPDRHLPNSLLKHLQCSSDEFWSWHYTLRSPRLRKAQPLLGVTRVTDLAVNVVLPWLWSRAGEGRRENVREELERRFFAWPAAADNSLLRLARQRLLGGAPATTLLTAAAQQGLIQIVRDFCEQSNALCDHCRFPAMVKEWGRSPS